MINNSPRFAGDVDIKKCVLTSIASEKSFDIINQVVAIQVFEDMFSPYISGNLILKESLDLLNFLPITGQEWLELYIQTPSLKEKDHIVGKFFIYKISDREYIAERNVVYKLHFMSEHALKDASTILSKGFKGTISDIAKEILTDWVSEENIGEIEQTKNDTRYVSNFWNPSKNLNYISNNAINMEDSPTYLSFQNRAGFNFVSLHKLYKQEPIRTFNHNIKARKIESTGKASRVLENDYSRITSIELPDSFDNVYKMTKGAFASTLHSFDVVSKEYKVDYFQYRNKFDDRQHLNKFPLTPKKMEEYFNDKAHVMSDFRQYGVFNKYGDVSNYKIMQERTSSLIQSEGLSVRIIVPGRTDYTVGQKVKLEIIKPNPVDKEDSKEEQIDNTFSGYYLIAAINHKIDRERHECSMELIKDSWEKNVDSYKE